MWTEAGMGAGGAQQEGKGLVLCVHKQADTWDFLRPRVWVLASREDNSEGSSLLCPEQWPDSLPCAWWVTCLGRRSLCSWVLLISKVQHHHWESPSDRRCHNSFEHSWALVGGGPLNTAGGVVLDLHTVLPALSTWEQALKLTFPPAALRVQPLACAQSSSLIFLEESHSTLSSIVTPHPPTLTCHQQ